MRAASTGVCVFLVASATCWIAPPALAIPINLVINGSFEGPTGVPPSGWTVGGSALDGYGPVAIAYGQTGSYPFGAQGESVPADNAASASPDLAGSNGVYFVSDEAKNLSLYQYVHLTPGSYSIGFDSYDTRNGNEQPHDGVLTAEIAGVQLANFSLASVSPGSWFSHSGTAEITTEGNYLVSFVFNTPDTPANPDPLNPGGEYNAKDVVIDRAFVIADAGGGGTVIPSVPIPGALPMFGAALVALGAIRYGTKRKGTAAA